MNIRKVLSAGLIGVVSVMLVFGIGCDGGASPGPTETETATAPAPVSLNPAATSVPTRAEMTPVPTDAPTLTPTAPAPDPAGNRTSGNVAVSGLWEMRGGTPLHRAVFDGDADAVADLLDRGADISALATVYHRVADLPLESATPLHVAALVNSGPEVATLLLDRGADVNARSESAGPFQSHGGEKTRAGCTPSRCALPVIGSLDDHSGQSPLSKVNAAFLSRLNTAPP